jgi:hypothetical protein
LIFFLGAQARALVRDYGLREHDVRERNLNRFMAHVGVQFNLIPIPVMVDGVVYVVLPILLTLGVTHFHM